MELRFLIVLWFLAGAYLFDCLNIDYDELSTFDLCIGFTVVTISAPVIIVADLLITAIEMILGEEVFDDDG